ncbi:hypothetical protein CRG98_010612 [Punica granatum]|uniref:Uncharacterized protein n=1 Tax=Punica granatum TaxID=22663 RepID=A0A2I0KKZ3_PUNGR|nr:hypothetical protein CRG98_010612 [Punica granatum]
MEEEEEAYDQNREVKVKEVRFGASEGAQQDEDEDDEGEEEEEATNISDSRRYTLPLSACEEGGAARIGIEVDKYGGRRMKGERAKETKRAGQRQGNCPAVAVLMEGKIHI